MTFHLRMKRVDFMCPYVSVYYRKNGLWKYRKLRRLILMGYSRVGRNRYSNTTT